MMEWDGEKMNVRDEGEGSTRDEDYMVFATLLTNHLSLDLLTSAINGASRHLVYLGPEVKGFATRQSPCATTACETIADESLTYWVDSVVNRR
jgi:hypothetical protein